MRLITTMSVWQDYKSVNISPEAITTATWGHWLPTRADGLSKPLSVPLNLYEITLSLHIHSTFIHPINSYELTLSTLCHIKGWHTCNICVCSSVCLCVSLCVSLWMSVPSVLRGAERCAGCGRSCWPRRRPSAESLHSRGGQPAHSTSKGSGQTGPHGPAVRALLHTHTYTHTQLNV